MRIDITKLTEEFSMHVSFHSNIDIIVIQEGEGSEFVLSDN